MKSTFIWVTLINVVIENFSVPEKTEETNFIKIF